MSGDRTPTLLDDPLDDDVRELLLGLDRGDDLTVDVDEVLRRGARRRRALVVERVLAVAAVVVVAAGVGTFALSRTTTPDLIPLGSDPSPTGERHVSPQLGGGTSGTSGDPKRKVGWSVFEASNTTRDTVTVTGLSVGGAPGTTRAVMTGLLPQDQQTVEISDALLAKLDQPSPTTVDIPPGRAIFVITDVALHCDGSDAAVRPTITLALRSPHGDVGSHEIDWQSWLPTATQYACGHPPKA
jgi:hypothetical protein